MVGRGLASGLARFLRWFFVGGLGVQLSGVGGSDQDFSFRSGARRILAFFLLVRVAALLGIVALVAWSQRRPALATALAGGLFFVAWLWFWSRSRARARLIEVGTGPLSADPLQPDVDVTAHRLLPARALQTLAVALDHARRGDVASASRLVRSVDVDQLEPDEHRLLVGVTSLIADRDSDGAAAARAAVAAFPTGVPEVDERLATIHARAIWHDGVRVAQALERWVAAGFAPEVGSAVGRKILLMQIKLGDDPALLPEEAEMLAEEAKTLGDPELERRLRAVARRSQPGYR